MTRLCRICTQRFRVPKNRRNQRTCSTVCAAVQAAGKQMVYQFRLAARTADQGLHRKIMNTQVTRLSRAEILRRYPGGRYDEAALARARESATHPQQYGI